LGPGRTLLTLLYTDCVSVVCLGRLVKNNDEVNARTSRQAVEAKLPYMLKFLASTDDDVSGNIAPFAHDYLTLLKQTAPLSDCQKEFVKVQVDCGWI